MLSLLKTIFKYFLVILVRRLKTLFSIVPIKKNRLLFHVHERKGLCCNNKYIVEYLLQKYSEEYEIVWATNYPDSIKNNEIIVVKTNSFNFFYYYYTSKVIITNDYISAFLSKRSAQLFINTWHAGVAYKKVGLDIKSLEKIDRWLFKLRHNKTDYMISGSESFTTHMSKSMNIPKEKFLPFGSPRTDILFNPTNTVDKKTKIVLFAPTFRDNNYDPMLDLNWKKLLTILTEKFGGEWKFMYRGHYFSSESYYGQDILNGNNIDDIQELMLKTDILLTDYSSLIWDFSFTGKPSFMFTPDLDTYINEERSFYTPIESWPYPKSKNMDDLIKKIKNFDNDNYLKKITTHHDQMGNYSNGDAVSKCVDFIRKNT